MNEIAARAGSNPIIGGAIILLQVRLIRVGGHTMVKQEYAQLWLSPNKLGIYDTVGNVRQWTNDARGILKGGLELFSRNGCRFKSSLSDSSAANYVGFLILRNKLTYGLIQNEKGRI